MKHPLISIITVCFNSEKNIKDTIESVLNQSYQNFEYIIIDGGSIDRTLEIVKKYEPKFKGKLRWISEKDEGIYDAMNKGINLAKGELIGIINSDDWYNSKALEMIVNNYKKDIEIYYGDIYKFDKINNYIYIRRANGNKLDLIKNKMSILHPSCFASRSWYKKFKFDETYRIASDYKFILESFINGANFKYIHFPFSFMRSGGISSSQGILGIKEVMYIQDEVLGKKFSSMKYIFKILIYKFYVLIYNILLILLPETIFNKIKKIKGWEIYKYQDNKKNNFY